MLNKYFYNISVSIVGIITSIFILTTVGGLFHIPVNPFFVLIPFIGGIYYLKKQSDENVDFLKQFLILLILIMISYVIAFYVWDVSWDGRGSHAATIIMYKNGWLPIYQNYQDFALKCNVYPESAFWGNCYLHFVEIIGANIYKLTNLIESAKTTNFLMLSCLFMYSFVILKNFLPKKNFFPLLISSLFILNPICICQWFTNDVDIHIFISFSILLLTIIKIEQQQVADKRDLFFFVCSSLMLAMTKFTGCMYLFIICLIYLIYLLLLKREIKKLIKTILVIGGLIVITAINPFYTNFRDYGHPFYPLFGKNKIDIVHYGIPYGFQNMSYLERFLRSTFSDSVNSMDDAVDDTEIVREPVELKIPFTIHKKTIFHTFCHADMRVGGFGYFWSGILLLSLFYLPYIRFRNKNEKYLFWLMLAMILTTTFSNPQNWWARYVPQFWLFPVFILFFGFLQDNFKNKYSKNLKAVLLCFITVSTIVNSLIIIKHNSLFSFYASSKLRQPYNYIDSVKKTKDKIYLMKIPEWENMVIADETVIPHMQEYYGKENVIVIPYDEKNYNSPEFIPLQAFCIISRHSYFAKIGN